MTLRIFRIEFSKSLPQKPLDNHLLRLFRIICAYLLVLFSIIGDFGQTILVCGRNLKAKMAYTLEKTEK
jgi:hypothetical protein